MMKKIVIDTIAMLLAFILVAFLDGLFLDGRITKYVTDQENLQKRVDKLEIAVFGVNDSLSFNSTVKRAKEKYEITPVIPDSTVNNQAADSVIWR